MAKLTPNEERVLSLRASGLTLREIAEAMGWGGSKERVRQIEARARRKKGEERRKKMQLFCVNCGEKLPKFRLKWTSKYTPLEGEVKCRKCKTKIYYTDSWAIDQEGTVEVIFR